MDDGAIGHVVISQRVGILDEDALENRQCALARGNLALSTSLSLTNGSVRSHSELSKYRGLKEGGGQGRSAGARQD